MINRAPPPRVAEAANFYVDVASGLPLANAAMRFSKDRECLTALRYLHEASEAVLQLADVFLGAPSAPAENEPLGEQQPKERGQTCEAVVVPAPTSTEQGAYVAGGRYAAQHSRDDLRLKLDGLKNYRDLRHIAGELSERISVEAVPRQGSRGNALIWVLHHFRRNEGLSLDDLEYAFKRMGVFTNDDPQARRKVAWELGELGRKGWPIKINGSLHCLALPGGRS